MEHGAERMEHGARSKDVPFYFRTLCGNKATHYAYGSLLEVFVVEETVNGRSYYLGDFLCNEINFLAV